MYQLFVGEIGIDRDVFLHQLAMWEIRSIVKGYRRRASVVWDSSRWQTFVWLKARGVKEISKPEDLLNFPWDNVSGTPMDEDERRELQEVIRAENERLKNEKGGE